MDFRTAAYGSGRPVGTDIVSIASGVVADHRSTVPAGGAGASQGLGEFITVLHNPRANDAFHAAFVRLQAGSIMAAPAAKIDVGALIALSGNT